MSEPVVETNLRLESEFTAPSAWCPDPGQWTSVDENAAESEVIEFLYALIVLTKAKVVVETGTYEGDTTRSLAWAVSLHGGRVYTAETDLERYKFVDGHFGATSSVACFYTTGVDLIQNLDEKIDLAFLDSSIEARADELRALYLRMRPGGVVVVHDAAPHHATMSYLGSLKGWNYLRFRTPRGLLVLQRTEDVSAVVL